MYICMYKSNIYIHNVQYLHRATGHYNPNTFSLSSLSNLIWNWHPQKWWFPHGINPETPRTPISWPPMPSHACDAAQPGILYVYSPCINDVVGLEPIFTFPIEVFCEIIDPWKKFSGVRVKVEPRSAENFGFWLFCIGLVANW